MKILSLDGGGIRGAITAQYLELLEKDLNQSLYDTFDLIAGTSTGAILALLIAGNKATGKECVELYNAENAKKIMNKSFWDRYVPFDNEPKYDGVGKTKILKKYFKSKCISDLQKDVLITAYDIVTHRIVTFKNQGSDVSNDPTLVEVADATSAAPTYFPTVKTQDSPPRWLVDGGLAANDPSMCALSAAISKGIDLNDIKLVSIGTGIQTRSLEKNYGKNSQKWGGIGWLKHGLIDHLFSGNTSCVEYQCESLLKSNYIKVNGPLQYCDDDMDNVSEGNINNLRTLGKEWYRDTGKEVVKLIN